MSEMENFQARSSRVGAEYELRAVDLVTEQGWTILGRKIRKRPALSWDVLAIDLAGRRRRVGAECKGGDFRTGRGCGSSDNIWKVLGQTLVLHNWNRFHPGRRWPSGSCASPRRNRPTMSCSPCCCAPPRPTAS